MQQSWRSCGKSLPSCLRGVRSVTSDAAVSAYYLALLKAWDDGPAENVAAWGMLWVLQWVLPEGIEHGVNAYNESLALMRPGLG